MLQAHRVRRRVLPPQRVVAALPQVLVHVALGDGEAQADAAEAGATVARNACTGVPHALHYGLAAARPPQRERFLDDSLQLLQRGRARSL